MEASRTVVAAPMSFAGSLGLRTNLLAPYRLVRRGSRKRKREARMHQETLQAIRESQQRPPEPGPGA
jgi:hypothetical protein